MDLSAPNAHAMAIMALTGIALVLFTRERIPLETSSLFVLVALVAGLTLFPYDDGRPLDVTELFHGFGHKALIAVCALMVLGQGLIRTGALEPVGRVLARLWRRGPVLSLAATLVLAATMSAFINNTPIVVLMLPLLIGIATRTGSSSSGTLLPMGLASLVGGMCTTIGTSTNLLVVSVAEDMGVPAFQMFDFFLPALGAGVVALVYLTLVAPRLLPERRPPMTDASSRRFTAQIVLGQHSVVCGRTLIDAQEATEGRLRVEKIQRGQGVFITPLPDVVLNPGDRLTTTARADQLREFARELDGELYSGEQRVDDDHPLEEEGQQLAEVAITAGSSLSGMALSEANLLARYGLRFLALQRIERDRFVPRLDLDRITLRVGDVLLVQASREKLTECKLGTDFLVLDGGIELPRSRKAPLAMAILLTAVGLAAFDVLPIEISALAGCLFMLATGCLTWRDATAALNVQVILIVVASLALGEALMRTGAADFLAQVFLAITFASRPAVVLGGLMIALAVLTNVVSNNAAAVIGTPIAIGIASRLGLPVEPFVLAVLFGANLSFATPMAYKTNILVMNAGGYRFGDFVRVGVPLLVLMWLSLTTILVYAYRL
ncbi:MAG: SLC13 family permease [Pseudomonadota bacterium]